MPKEIKGMYNYSWHTEDKANTAADKLKELWGDSSDAKIKKILKDNKMLDYEEEVLLDRYVDNKTLKQIAETKGFTSPSVVLMVLKQALAKLKRRMGKHGKTK